MKFTSTLAVASFLSAVFVSAVPVPVEIGTAYEALTVREITDMVLDEIFERQPSNLGQALWKAGKDTGDMLPKKLWNAANTPTYKPSALRWPAPNAQPPAARPPSPIRPVKVPPFTLPKAAAQLDPATKWRNTWAAGQARQNGH